MAKGHRRAPQKSTYTAKDGWKPVTDTIYGGMVALKDFAKHTDAQIAEHLGVSGSTVARYLRERKPPSELKRKPRAKDAAKAETHAQLSKVLDNLVHRTETFGLFMPARPRKHRDGSFMISKDGSPSYTKSYEKETIRLRFPSAGSLARALRQCYDKKFAASKSSVLRALHGAGFNPRARSKRPMLSQNDKHLRVIYANRMIQLGLQNGAGYFELIVFSDEKTFDCQDNGGRTQWVLRGEPVLGRDRSMSAPSVQIFGLLSIFGFLVIAIPPRHQMKHEEQAEHDLNLEKQRSEMLARTAELDSDEDDDDIGRELRNFAVVERRLQAKVDAVRGLNSDRFCKHVIGAIAAKEKELRRAKKEVWWKDVPGLIVQQDGLSTHWTAPVLDAWKHVAGVNVVGAPADPRWRWPPRSCDLSPIENAWSILARRVSERGPLDIEDLVKFVEMDAARFTPETRENLCCSFKDRLVLCAANGGETVRLPHRSAADKRKA
jgi:transposase